MWGLHLILIITLIISLTNAKNISEYNNKRYQEDTGATEAACTLATTCTDGRIQYTASGQITGSAELLSVGNNIDIGQSGLSITPQSPSKLILRGTNSNQPNGPHIQTYTNESNYAYIQLLSYTHDNMGLIMGAFLDSSANWKASDSTGFRIYKYGGNMLFDSSSGNTAGNSVSWINRASISASTGIVSMGTSTITTGTISTATLTTATVTANLYLPTSGGTPSGFNHYEEYNFDVHTSSYSGGSVSSVAVAAKVLRIGGTVYVKIPATYVTVSGSSANIGLDTVLPSRFRPLETINQQIDSTLTNPNLAVIDTSGQMYCLFSFSVGSSRGWVEDFVVSYTVI